MNRGYLKPVYKKFRYKVFKTDDGFYLVDCDYWIWWFVFPFLNWFYAIPVHKISEKTALALTEKVKIAKKRTIFAAAFIGALIPSLIRSNTQWLEYLTLDVARSVNIIILLLVGLLALCMRWFYSKKTTIDIAAISEGEKRFKIKPYTGQRMILIVFSVLVMTLFAVVCPWIYLETQSIIILISSGFFFYLCTLLNCVTMGIESIQLKEKLNS